MKKYHVHYSIIETVEVEAENEEQAVALANDTVVLCHDVEVEEVK